VTNGSVTLNSANAAVTNNGTFTVGSASNLVTILNYNAVNAAGGAQNITMGGRNAQINLGFNGTGTTDSFTLVSGSVISGTNAQLADLTWGTTLFSANAGVVAERAAGGNAGILNISSITTNTLYFGLAANVDESASTISVGGNHVWR